MGLKLGILWVKYRKEITELYGEIISEFGKYSFQRIKEEIIEEMKKMQMNENTNEMIEYIESLRKIILPFHSEEDVKNSISFIQWSMNFMDKKYKVEIQNSFAIMIGEILLSVSEFHLNVPEFKSLWKQTIHDLDYLLNTKKITSIVKSSSVLSFLIFNFFFFFESFPTALFPYYFFPLCPISLFPFPLLSMLAIHLTFPCLHIFPMPIGGGLTSFLHSSSLSSLLFRFSFLLFLLLASN